MPALRRCRQESAMWPVRLSSHGEALACMTPVLKELSEFEVELPARRRSPLSVNLVEPIPDINTQRSERTQRGGSEAKAPEQSRRIELARFVPVSYTHLRAHETVLDLV